MGLREIVAPAWQWAGMEPQTAVRITRAAGYQVEPDGMLYRVSSTGMPEQKWQAVDVVALALAIRRNRAEL